MVNFEPEKIAGKYCEQYSIKKGTEMYANVVNAICVVLRNQANDNCDMENTCECGCPMLEDGRCQKGKASCYMVKPPISQKQTIEKIIEMAIPSLDPDSYTSLLDIMERLAATRGIDWKP